MSYYLKPSKEFFPMHPNEKFDRLQEYIIRLEEYFDNGKPNAEQMTSIMQEIDRTNDYLKELRLFKQS